MREAANTKLADREYYYPDSRWFTMLFDAIIERAVAVRNAASTESRTENANISAVDAAMLACPIYNHFCVYRFVAADSKLFSKTRPDRMAKGTRK